MVHHLEMYSLRSVPIIALINFLVGAIVTHRGVFQLARFGASPYAVNLAGALGLRELGVLMTSIMIAARTGSAITAEIGSMNMREEIDALKVMALDPLEVLIVPRLVALAIALPILTFVADMAELAGGRRLGNEHTVCYTFSCGFNSGHFAGKGINVMLGGTVSRPERCQPA
jgi:phospholipid/cholesterol/gamma-HCH transport system permease protein